MRDSIMAALTMVGVAVVFSAVGTMVGFDVASCNDPGGIISNLLDVECMEETTNQ